MTKTIVILQSNYIPWKGYFDLLAAADEFLIFDEVQFTRRDWRNRNKLIVAGKPHWLSIPVQSKGNYEASVENMTVVDHSWAKAHWTTLVHNYRRAPHFAWGGPPLEEAYRQAGALDRLTDINELFLQTLAGLVGVTTPLLRTNIVPRISTDPTERLIEILRARGADHYISGPAAKAYLDLAAFQAAGIKLSYANYSGYPEYEQASASFEHGVSFIDVLMRCGLEARTHLKSINGRGFLD